MKLKDIAEIRTGQVLSRKQAKEEEVGIQYRVFTLSSIDKDGTIKEEQIDDFKSNSKLDDNVITKEEDIIMRLSNPYTSAYIKKQFKNILIPSLVAVIRIKSDEYIPEFVKIYLNSENAKEQIRKEANGTVIATITTKSIKELEIPLIPKKQQQYIIHFTNTYLEEKKQTERLLELKEREYQYIINENMKQGENR